MKLNLHSKILILLIGFVNYSQQIMCSDPICSRCLNDVCQDCIPGYNAISMDNILTCKKCKEDGCRLCTITTPDLGELCTDCGFGWARDKLTTYNDGNSNLFTYMTCKKCGSNCERCFSAEKCQFCSKDYIVKNGSCSFYTNNTKSNVGLIVGLCVGGFVLLIVVVTFICYKKANSKKKKQSDSITIK